MIWGWIVSMLTRFFNGQEGQVAAGDGGPEAIKTDLDNLFGAANGLTTEVSNIDGRVTGLEAEINADVNFEVSGSVPLEPFVSDFIISANGAVTVQGVQVAVPHNHKVVLDNVRHTILAHGSENLLRLQIGVLDGNTWTASDFRGDETPDFTLRENTTGVEQLWSLVIKIYNPEAEDIGLRAYNGWASKISVKAI